mmetsp:Transcript_40722/g.116638  ORF Transcript_40722/g.116638 Transcript_40722/m.116638 type:complete len:106 (-) Transcript_40722:51-368(-)
MTRAQPLWLAPYGCVLYGDHCGGGCAATGTRRFASSEGGLPLLPPPLLLSCLLMSLRPLRCGLVGTRVEASLQLSMSECDPGPCCPAKRQFDTREEASLCTLGVS